VAAYDCRGRVPALATGSVGTGFSGMDIRVLDPAVTSASGFTPVTTSSKIIPLAGIVTESM